MNEKSKVIASIANILKIIVIVSIIVILAIVTVFSVKSKIDEEKERKAQVVAEISYTDDVKVKTELEKFGDKFSIKLYDEEFENDRFLITVIGVALFIVELILLAGALGCVNKFFFNMKENQKQLSALRFITVSKVILLLAVNLLTYILFKALEISPVIIIETVLVIILTVICYVINLKNK